MLVNSAFKGFFNHRLVVRSGITMPIPIAIGIRIVMLAIFFIASSFTKHSDPDLRAKQLNLIIRQIGDRLLLQAGDSISRVLPVTETKAGTFLLSFENEFVFSHDSLLVLTQSLLPKTQFPSGYTVTVHDCTNAGIVYGFQINNTSPDMLLCRGRRQPPGCYTIEFAFSDFYETIEQEQKKAGIAQLTEKPKSFKVDPQEAKPTEEIKPATVNDDIDQLTVELKSFKVNPPEARPMPIPIAIGTGTEELKATTSDYPFINLVFIGMLALLGVAMLIGRFGEGILPVRVPNQNHAITKVSVPELAVLGKFLFDVKSQHLLLGSEVITLTDKECRILELLNESFGELIPRETLMEKIWINEGVITGRSLDMFVSKLRKKLSSDPELKITNVHGKGYKLEIPGVQVL